MCGILGFNWNDKKLASELGKLIKHRGPDDTDIYCDKDVSLGHRRLSIIDISKKGKQPMSDGKKELFITYNGEIFNFQDIKNELIKKGYKFRSKTDTEVIIYGYKEYGHKILDKLNGQFAFCIYDKKKKELFLARDRIGINPLYYYFNKEKFIFGSELKVILKSVKEKTINEFAFDYYLAYGYTPRKQSIIDNAYKLEPGHYLIFDLQNKQIKEHKQYWDYCITKKITDEKEAKKRIITLLDESVRERLLADVPVGAFLSGGLDSSAICAFAKKYKKDLNTFTIKFDEDKFDESKYAEKVAKMLGTKHHVINFNAKTVRKLIPKLAYHYDEPFSDPSMIPTYLVSKIAREHVIVSLSGDGGDELFGGYDSYKQHRILKVQRFYPKFINKFFYHLTKKIQTNNFKFINAFFHIGTLPKDEQFGRLMSFLSPYEFKQIIGRSPEKVYREHKKYYLQNNLNTAINSDLHLYLPDDILTKVDRASLANSLESRPPFLNHKMVELANSIDPKLKLKGREGKWILKKSLEKILPKEIIYRKKKGFSVPLEHYLRKDLQDIIVDNVLKFESHNLFDKQFLETAWKTFIKGKKDYSLLFWRILMFNLWYDKWFSSKNK